MGSDPFDLLSIVQELELPQPFNLQGLCDALAAHRNRPILVLAVPFPPEGPTGLWVATAEADYLFLEADTSPLHQEHIGLHELGHLICGHEAVSLSDQDATWLLLPDLDAAMVHQVLGRTDYTDAEERAAEQVATLIGERAGVWSPERTWPVPVADAEVVARLRSSLAREIT